jgi:putative aldouronate transport system substrate-binding protein
MKKQRLLSFVMAAAVTAGIFAGCSKPAENKEPKGNAPEDKRVEELKVLFNYDKNDMNADPTAKLIEELTGQKVKYEMLPAENANEKLNLEVAGNAQFHAIKMNREQFETLASKNALLDLKPLLDKHGPNLKKAISQESWNVVTINGKILGVPEKNSSDNVNFGIAVRKDILEKHNIAVPKTVEEFEKAAEQLKGKEGILHPIAAPVKNLNNGIIGAFGAANKWNAKGEQLAYWGTGDNYKAYLDYMKNLHDKGYLGSDWVTIKADAAIQRFVTGQSAFLAGVAWWSGAGLYDGLQKQLNVEKVEDTFSKVVWIPSLENNGVKGTFRDKKINFVTGIPKYMEAEAVAAIKWMDKKLEKENFRKIVIGDENYHYTVKDGKYYPNLEKNDAGVAKFDEKGSSSWFLTGTIEEDYANYWLARVRKSAQNLEAWTQLNKDAGTFGVYDPLGFAPLLPAWSSKAQKLDTAVEDFATQYITGKETDYNKLEAALKGEGLDEAAKAVNDWYKDNKK